MKYEDVKKIMIFKKSKDKIKNCNDCALEIIQQINNAYGR